MKIIFSILFITVSFFSFAQTPQLIIPRGHNADVKLLAISPDKKWLASGDENGTVKLWDIQTAKEVKTFDYNPTLSILNTTTALAFSPDSKKLYTGIGSTLIINDLTNAAKEILNKEIHENKITQILFGGNGKIFITAADDEVKIWDADNLATPKVVAIKGKKPKLAFDDANNLIAITTGNYLHVSSSFDFTEITTNKGYITHINIATGQIISTDEFENLKDDETFISLNGKLLAITRYEKLAVNNDEVSVGTVQLFDISSLKIVKKIIGIQDSSIYTLSFSKNNRYLATKAGTSFRIYDLATFEYVKTFYSEDISTKAMLFSADGTKLYQGVNSNGSVVQWNLNESTVGKVFGSGANFVKDLAVTPNQQSIVLLYGTSDYRSKNLFLQNLDFNSIILSKIKSEGIVNSMQNFNIASAGGGRLFEPNTLNMVDAILSNQTVTAFSISNNNKILVATNQYELQPQLSFYNLEDGKKMSNISLQKSAYSLLFAKDDKVLYVGYEGNNKIDKIEIKTGTILKTFEHVDSYSKEKKIKQMLLSKDESTLIGINDYYKIYSWNTATGVESKLNISSDAMGFALKAVPNTNAFVYGDGEKNIETYDLSANKIIRSLINNSKTKGALDITNDGKFIFYSNADKSVSIWDITKKALVATMVFFGEKDWVIIDKAGRFDGTVIGMNNMHYVKGLEILPLEAGYEQFYTPHLLPRILEGENFAAPPVNINSLKIKPKAKIMYAETQRNLEVSDDITTYKNTTGIAQLTINATAPDDKVDEIRLFHNGKIVNLATRGLFVTDNDGSDSKKYTINLLPGNNNFRAIALNSQRTESYADEIIVSYSANGNQPVPQSAAKTNNAVISSIDKTATMYLMVIGINAYTNKIKPLSYALPDATAFKEEIEKDAKSILANVKTYFITDAKADKAGIINAFNEIKKDAKPQDVFVFYYAGHGYISPTNKEFYLVSANVADGGESLLKNGIAAKELQQYAVDIQAQKQLFILDACQSAGAFGAMLQHDGEQQKSLAVVARSTGTHWMAASGSTETAKEFGELGHGAFTYVLLQALKGQAAANKMITVNGMKNFLQIQVPELVKKYGSNNQFPASYGFGNDFPVEMLK